MVREVSTSEIRRLIGVATAEAVDQVASLYATTARSLAETGQCQVIFVMRPDELDPADAPEEVQVGDHLAHQEVVDGDWGKPVVIRPGFDGGFSGWRSQVVVT